VSLNFQIMNELKVRTDSSCVVGDTEWREVASELTVRNE
jgi:hypothetical protein